MSEPNSHAIADLPAPSNAVLLCGEQSTPEDRNLSQLLEFFDIPWKPVRARDRNMDDCHGTFAVVSPAAHMANAMEDAQSLGAALPAWITKASSVYVYGFEENERSTNLLRLLTGNPQATVSPIQSGEATMTIAGGSPEMCGPMSGLRMRVRLRAPGCILHLGQRGKACEAIIQADAGQVFLGATYAGVRFYLNAWSRILDIGALSPSYFDVKKFFCEAVPSVFYLKWAFRDTILSSSEINACLIVDDPPLKRRYGFLDFREALDLMDRHNFTTTIAFIPWNWRRTHPRTVHLFQKHPERFSVVVHGCDHTADEFAARSPAYLNRMIKTSRQRMESFRQRTSIKADSVMVFPQGRFSPEAGRALKLNGFVAAVNTEVAPVQEAAVQTRISDLWNIAIMRYGTFPIFTRRYAHHGIENFAFDGLLGKPCLIAAHHDAFKDHARDLVDFVARLNSLRWNLVWRPLGEVVRRSFGIRWLDDGTEVIRMFSGSLLVENLSPRTSKALVLKDEDDGGCIEGVWVNQKPVECSVEGGYLRICLLMLPREMVSIRVAYRNNLKAIPDREGFGTRIKIATKRYLSEFRDNYLSRSPSLYQTVSRLKHLVP